MGGIVGGGLGGGVGAERGGNGDVGVVLVMGEDLEQEVV